MTNSNDSLDLTLSYVDSFALTDHQRLRTFTVSNGIVSLSTYAGDKFSLPVDRLRCRIARFGNIIEYTIEEKASRNQLKIRRADTDDNAESWQRIDAFLESHISDDSGIGKRSAHRRAIADEYYQSDRSILQTYFLDPVFRRFADFKGRMSRKEFLGFIACNYAIISFLMILLPLVSNTVIAVCIIGIYQLLILIPLLSAAKRYSNVTYKSIFPLTVLQYVVILSTTCLLYIGVDETITRMLAAADLLVSAIYIIVLYLSCYADDNSPKPIAKRTPTDMIVICTVVFITIAPIILYTIDLFTTYFLPTIYQPSWFDKAAYPIAETTTTILLACIVVTLRYFLVYIILKYMHNINERQPSYDRPLNE